MAISDFYRLPIDERVEVAAQVLALEADYWENMNIAVANGIAKAIGG